MVKNRVWLKMKHYLSNFLLYFWREKWKWVGDDLNMYKFKSQQKQLTMIIYLFIYFIFVSAFMIKMIIIRFELIPETLEDVSKNN